MRAAAPESPAATAALELPNVPLPGGGTLLPNGWKISPAGNATALPGDMPMGLVVTPDGKYLLASTGGYNTHGISVLDAHSGQLLQSITVPQAFAGLHLDAAGRHVWLSAGGGVQRGTAPLYRFALDAGHLKEEPGLEIDGLDKKAAFIAGLAATRDGTLFAANLNEDCIYRLENGAGSAGHVHRANVGHRPGALALSTDDKVLAVANWGDQTVTLLEAQTLHQAACIKTGSHPSAVLWSKDGRLFVANAGGNTVSVIDAAAGKVTETIRTSLDFQLPVGSTPLALALDNAAHLYVANADNNDVAVVDVSQRSAAQVRGFIPTAWYPSALALAADGQTLFVGTAKGLKFAANGVDKRHIGNILMGHVSRVAVPDGKALAGYTRQVLANCPVPQAAAVDPAAREGIQKALHQIKHVLYIIKENRTYDQVFGDLPEGNGDPHLVLFGQKVTPNHHALARQWVLLDNLYCNGEVSEDGHAWCDAAYCNDFTEKRWLTGYGGRVNPDADERISRSPGGYIWDAAVAHHLSFRTYGEGEEFVSSPAMEPDVDVSKIRAQYLSPAWQKKRGKRDYERADAFIADLHAAEAAGSWPNLMVMSLGEDHTHGRSALAFAPDAAVGSNDLALGKIVEAVSASRFWPQTAIFVIEDDAQNGHDHVDAHRTMGLLIAPYVKRGAVDHTMYTTASMLRTMELMLDLPPLTQYDAAATPMFNCFTATPDLRPYTVVPAQVDLARRNPLSGKGAKASAALDFSEYDRADADQLNTILWEYCRPGEPEPAPVRSLVFVR